jgi:hypothetical protein
VLRERFAKNHVPRYFIAASALSDQRRYAGPLADNLLLMPFTLAHPAAIIPVYRAIGSGTSLSALVIGSMMPDLVYFVPLGVSAQTSHSLRGLLLFSIPAGLIAFALFHLLLKRPGAALLPAPIHRRLSPAVMEAPRVTPAFLLTVMLSLGLGALTHIAWDAFTHGNTFVVNRFDMLRMAVGSIGGYKLYVYKFLQHLSGLLGLLALTLWVFNWTTKTPATGFGAKALHLPFKYRVIVITGILATALAFAAVNSVSRWTGSVERILMHATVGALVGAALSTGVFCIGWHAFHWYRKRCPQVAANS